MALPTKLLLEIVTPDRVLVTEQVDELQVPGAEGYFGVLPGHAPLLASLHVGELWYRKGQEKHYLAIAFGFVEVLPDKVTVLARIAEREQDIDVIKQEADRRAAEGELQSAVTAEDAERARIAMLTAMVKLRAAERVRMKRGI